MLLPSIMFLWMAFSLIYSINHCEKSEYLSTQNSFKWFAVLITLWLLVGVMPVWVAIKLLGLN